MEALGDTASYVKKRQEIDAENLAKLQEGLAKSRQRLMGDLDVIFGVSEDVGLTKTLDKVGLGRKERERTTPLRLKMPIICSCVSVSLFSAFAAGGSADDVGHRGGHDG